jgi:hypothetical protein
MPLCDARTSAPGVREMTDEQLSVQPGQIFLLVGTTKGAFLFRTDPERRETQVSGPHMPGQPVYALAYDDRGDRRRVLAGAESWHWGPQVYRSDDLGATWSEPVEGGVRFPEEAGAALKRVWQLKPAGADQPDVVYAGVEPAALFRSKDGGESFELLQGLWDHPHRPKWEPGGGGLCLHTVVLDPDDPARIWVAISAAGVYYSTDGGVSWETRHQGVRADFRPDRYPEFGQCVHKIAPAGGSPSRMYLQNHWGLYRSDDAGGQWSDIANGVPSDFGFPVVAHPSDPDSAWVIPLTSDEFWCTAEGRARVYRTRDAGASWDPLTKGLPQHNAYLTVLRDGFTTDGGEPAGLYFGTRTGELFASGDEGDSWKLLANWLPPVLCVRAAVVR